MNNQKHIAQLMALKQIDAEQAEQLLEDIDKLCAVVANHYLKVNQS